MPQLLTKSGLFSRRFIKTWLAGCSHSGKVYCFPCILFGDSQRAKAWTQSGVNDWCNCHIENCLKVAFLAKQISLSS